MADPIEQLARVLCEADGCDPDAMVTRNVIYERGVPGGIARFIPEPRFCMKAWTCYAHLALIAIEETGAALSGKNTSKFVDQQGDIGDAQ